MASLPFQSEHLTMDGPKTGGQVCQTIVQHFLAGLLALVSLMVDFLAGRHQAVVLTGSRPASGPTALVILMVGSPAGKLTKTGMAPKSSITVGFVEVFNIYCRRYSFEVASTILV